MVSGDDRELSDQLIELCNDFDDQNQALRNRVIELLTFAEREVSARVHLSQDLTDLRLAHEQLSDAHAELLVTHNELATHHQHLTTTHNELATHHQHLTTTHNELATHLDEVREQLRITEEALHAIENSMLFRLAQPFRSAYGRLRRIGHRSA
jgi:chromosome segregation ATPase